MAKIEFELPQVQDLTKDQKRVLRLPQDGQFLIVGGPGTGKSVVALLRTRQYKEDDSYLFLTYNHVLNSAINQWVDFPLTSNTTWSWFYQLQYNLTNLYMPETDDYKPDYDEVKNRFEALNLETRDDHLIIDEGQDVPPEFYDSLMCLGYENFFVVADQNQQITEENSSREELTNILGLEVEEVVELEENFRNTHAIGVFSQYFYTDKSSPKPKLSETFSLVTPILCEYKLVRSCVEMILRTYRDDDSKLIGLIVANDTKREDYVKQLNRVEVERGHGQEKPVISTYSNKNKQGVNIDFSQSGIVVLNDNSVKGIEFDVVFIVIDGFKIRNGNVNSMKKRFYVMSSRAKEKLVLFKSELYRDGVDSLFPDDEAILVREKI